MLASEIMSSYHQCPTDCNPRLDYDIFILQTRANDYVHGIPRARILSSWRSCNGWARRFDYTPNVDSGWHTRRRESSMGVPDYPYYESEDGRPPSTTCSYRFEVPRVMFCVCDYIIEANLIFVQRELVPWRRDWEILYLEFA